MYIGQGNRKHIEMDFFRITNVKTFDLISGGGEMIMEVIGYHQLSG